LRRDVKKLRVPRVTITVEVTVAGVTETPFKGLHVGLRGPGAWYEPSSETASFITIKRFKVYQNTGPHMVEAYTTDLIGDAEVVDKHVFQMVSVGRADKTIKIKL